MKMESKKTNIVYKETNDLIPYANNPRLNDNAVDAVAASIKEFGFKVPIVVDGENVIINGHTRLKAEHKLGLKQVPCIVADDLTPEQVKAFRLADNKTSELAEWDMDKLDIELGEIPDIDMSAFGFDVDIDYDEGTQPDQNLQEDGFCDDDVPQRASRGDVWILGSHRLMCGDSTSADDVARLMNGEKAQMCFTDPPYGVSFQSNMRTKTEKFDVLQNDDTILDFMPNVKKYTDGFIFVCTAWRVLDKWIPLFEKYLTMSNMIIWDKGGGGMGDLTGTFSTDYEIILVANQGAKIHGKRIGSVWSIGKDVPIDYIHPTQKPVALAGQAITSTSDRGDIVLDLFGGSGSTLISCQQLSRICYMMEVDPHYVDVIIERWENFTGQKAKLLKGV